MSANKEKHVRRGFQSVWRPHPLAQSEASPPPPLGDLIEAIDQKSLEDTTEGNGTFGITESELIASYNWVNQKNPKIIVPGLCAPADSIYKGQVFLTANYPRSSTALEATGASTTAF